MIKKLILKIKNKWEQEDLIIKRTIYILILFIPIVIIFNKQINILIKLISIKFGTSMDINQIWPINTHMIFLLILIIIAYLLSFLMGLIKKSS